MIIVHKYAYCFKSAKGNVIECTDWLIGEQDRKTVTHHDTLKNYIGVTVGLEDIGFYN